MVSIDSRVGIGCWWMSSTRAIDISMDSLWGVYRVLRSFMLLYGEPRDMFPWLWNRELGGRLALIFIASFFMAFLTGFLVTYSLVATNVFSIASLAIFSFLVSQLSINIYLWGLENDFYAGLSREYPLFILIYAMASKLNMYNLFHIIVSRFGGLLKYTSRVLGRWIIDYEFSEEPLDRIIFRSLESFRDIKFKSFVKDLVRVRAYGGSVEQFIENTLEDMYIDISVNWEENWRATVGRLEMIMLVFGLLPIIVMSVVSIAPPALVSNTFLGLIFLIPIVGYLMYIYLDKSIYRIPVESDLPFNPKVMLISIILSIILFFLLTRYINFVRDVVVITSVSLIILLLYPSISSIYTWLRERHIDNDLSKYLFDLEDLMRNGFSLREAVSRIRLEGFSREFINWASRLRYYLEFGDPGALRLKGPFSKLSRLTISLLSYISDVGGGLREVVYLRKMGVQYLRLKSRKASHAVAPLLTAVFIIFIGIYNYWIIYSIFVGIEAPSLPAFMVMVNTLNWLSYLYKLVLLEGILISGILISKVIHDSIYYPYPILILLISYIVGLTLFPF